MDVLAWLWRWLYQNGTWTIVLLWAASIIFQVAWAAHKGYLAFGLQHFAEALVGAGMGLVLTNVVFRTAYEDPRLGMSGTVIVTLIVHIVAALAPIAHAVVLWSSLPEPDVSSA